MVRYLSVLSAALLFGCAEPPSGALMRSPTLMANPTTASSIELGEQTGTLNLELDFSLTIAGEFMNDPEGEGHFEVVVKTRSVTIDNVEIPIDKEITSDRVAKIGLKGKRTGVAVETVLLRFEAPLSAELVEKLRPSCGKTSNLWIDGTWTSTELIDGPDSFALQAGGADIPNLQEAPVVSVRCPEP